MTLLCSSKITDKKSEGFSLQNLGWTLGCRSHSEWRGAKHGGAQSHIELWSDGLVQSHQQGLSAILNRSAFQLPSPMHQGWRDGSICGTSEGRCKWNESTPVIDRCKGVEQWKSILIFTLINACLTLEPGGKKSQVTPNKSDSIEFIVWTAPAGMNCPDQCSLLQWKEMLPMPQERHSFDLVRRDRCHLRHEWIAVYFSIDERTDVATRDELPKSSCQVFMGETRRWRMPWRPQRYLLCLLKARSSLILA